MPSQYVRKTKQLPHTSPFPVAAAAPSTAPTSANTLLSTPQERRPELPLSDDLNFLRDSISRFVADGIYLLAGAPSGGKSLLSTQIGLDLGRQNIRSLFILTEQGSSNLKETAMRITTDWDERDVARALDAIHVETGLYDVSSLPAFLNHAVFSPTGKYHGIKLLVLDSVQGYGLSGAAIKTYGKVLEASRLCAENKIAVILVNHVTKRGDIAGPKALEHGVDATLVMRRAMLYSVVMVRKNRFGPPMLRPIPLRIDPVTTRLALAPHAKPQPGAAQTYAGAAAGALQIQASVGVPPEGRQGRITAPGLPKREIEQLIDCLAQIEHLDLSDLDYRIQCRLPASGQYSTYFGLPLCVALIASYTRRTVPERSIYVGEVDLFRKVLAVPTDVLHALGAAIDSGEISTPLTLFVPPSAAGHLPRSSSAVKIVICRTLEDAIFQTWPDLR